MEEVGKEGQGAGRRPIIEGRIKGLITGRSGGGGINFRLTSQFCDK